MIWEIIKSFRPLSGFVYSDVLSLAEFLTIITVSVPCWGYVYSDDYDEAQDMAAYGFRPLSGLCQFRPMLPETYFKTYGFSSPVGVMSIQTRDEYEAFNKTIMFPSPVGVMSIQTNMKIVIDIPEKFPSPVGVMSIQTDYEDVRYDAILVSVPCRGYVNSDHITDLIARPNQMFPSPIGVMSIQTNFLYFSNYPIKSFRPLSGLCPFRRESPKMIDFCTNKFPSPVGVMSIQTYRMSV